MAANSIKIKTKERDYIIIPQTSNLKTVWLVALKSVVDGNQLKQRARTPDFTAHKPMPPKSIKEQ